MVALLVFMYLESNRHFHPWQGNSILVMEEKNYKGQVSSINKDFFIAENKEISAPSPCGLLIGIYKFYESWSTETFRKRVKEVGFKSI